MRPEQLSWTTVIRRMKRKGVYREESREKCKDDEELNYSINNPNFI